MSGQPYPQGNPWVDGFDNSAGVPFVPLGWWELAAGHELGKRSRLRSSGGDRPVQLVAVRVEDTSHRAKRAAWRCSCGRQVHQEHSRACEWWRNPWTWNYPENPRHRAARH